MVEEEHVHHEPKYVPPRRRSVLGSSVLAVLILGCGVIIGSAGTFLSLRDRIMPVIESGGDKASFAQHVAGRMQNEYTLTDPQKQKVADILARHIEAIESLRRTVEEVRIPQLNEELVANIRKVLTPEQFVEWKRDFDEMTARTRERGPRWGDRDRRGPRGPGDREGRGERGGGDGERGPRRGPGPEGFGPGRPPNPEDAPPPEAFGSAPMPESSETEPDQLKQDSSTSEEP